MGAGVGEAELVKAACDLQDLLSRRTSLGLGPLLHAQPYFSASGASGALRNLGQCASFSGPSTPVLQVRMFSRDTNRSKAPRS